jgi:DNA-binding NarL/FixJ family response regulator
MSETKPLPPANPSASAKHRVFVVDDHPLMRQSIIGAVERERDLVVCGHAADGPEALAAILSLRPDLVLTDLQLKSSSGLDLIKNLHEQSPALPVIATTMFDVRRNERLARVAGAVDFAAKQEGPEKLMLAVHNVLRTGRNF